MATIAPSESEYIKDPTICNNLLQQAKVIHARIINNGSFMKHADLIQNINNIHDMLINIRSIETQITELYNTCKRTIHDRCIISIELEPATSVASCNQRLQEVAPAVNVPVMAVDTAADVPNSPIFWIKDIEQFAIRMGGILCCGGIGELYTKHSQRQDLKNTVERVRTCKYGHGCSNSSCRYRHPGERRNFITSQWLFTEQPVEPKNMMLRHVGRRSTLREDIKQLKNNDEYECRRSQLIHDALVLQAIERYKIK